MSEKLKRILCVLLAMVMVLSLSACRHSPVLEQTVYSADGEVDPNNQQTDNDEEHSEEDTTLPPKTTTQNASREASQSRTSAKPKPTQQKPQTQTRSGSQTQATTGAKPESNSNSNKAQADTPGVNDNTDSPNKAVDNRSPVNPEEIPENVKNVAAVGEAALFVEMLGGTNRLLASSANFVGNAMASLAFGDMANVKGLWEKDGETAMTDAQFQQLLTTNPEAVFYVADAEYGTVQSFSESQLTQLNQKGIYTVPLLMFNTTDNIKNNVRIMGKVLGKRSDINGAKDANDMAEKYIKWIEEISKGFGHTFSGPEKWNLDQKGAFNSGDVEKVNSYAEDGQYTILISGWDDSVFTNREQGVAYARTGYTKRNSPASFFLSLGGAANTAALVTDTGGGIPYFPVVPTYMDMQGANVNGKYQNADTWRSKSNQVTGFAGNYIGKGVKKIIVDSGNTYNMIAQSLAWSPTEYVTDSEGSGGYGFINENGRLVASNIHGSDFQLVINPYGIGSWTEGSPESPLEALWANQLFNNGLSADDAFNAIAADIQHFYSEFYGYDLSGSDLEYIKQGA